MAEFCIECENRMGGDEYEPITEADVITDWDYCECCGRWTQCIVAFEPWYSGPKRKAQAVEHGPGLLARLWRAWCRLFEEARRRHSD